MKLSGLVHAQTAVRGQVDSLSRLLAWDSLTFGARDCSAVAGHWPSDRVVGCSWDVISLIRNAILYPRKCSRQTQCIYSCQKLWFQLADIFKNNLENDQQVCFTPSDLTCLMKSGFQQFLLPGFKKPFKLPSAFVYISLLLDSSAAIFLSLGRTLIPFQSLSQGLPAGLLAFPSTRFFLQKNPITKV